MSDEYPDYETRHAADIAYEAQLNQRVDYLASALLDACQELGWGSGQPMVDAVYRVEQTATRRGLHVQPVPPAPSARKKIRQGTVRRVWDRDGWRCVDCGTNENLTVDHKIPVSKGGTNDFDNLQTMCLPCNIRKGATVAET